MTKRTYVVIAVVIVLIVVGIAAAQWQRARKTVELLEDLDTESADLAVDTLHELKKRGHSIERQLLARLNSARKKERMRAALLLGELGTPDRSGPGLERLLEDEWNPVRRAAATGLGRLGYGPAVTKLLTMAQNEEQDMDTRCIAVQAVGMLALSGSLDQVDRKLCVRPLARILKGRPEVPPPVEEEEPAEEEEEGAEEEVAAEEEEEELAEEAAPADTEVELRKECVLALGLLSMPKAVEALIESVDDTVEPSTLVREHACMAIADVPEAPADDVAAAMLGGALLDALEDSAADVRMHAAMALAAHPDFRSEPLDSRINEMLKEMAQELAEGGETSYWVREAARVACNKRHVSLHETGTSNEGSS